MSAKPDFKHLLPAGIHKASLSDLHRIAVAPFPNDSKREQLYATFSQWIQNLQALQVTAILWVDGSFLTEKPSPGDIDCIMWNPSCLQPLTPELKSKIAPLLDRSGLGAQYQIDFYHESPSASEVFHREAYWKGVFGFKHDRVTAKGFVEIAI